MEMIWKVSVVICLNILDQHLDADTEEEDEESESWQCQNRELEYKPRVLTNHCRYVRSLPQSVPQREHHTSPLQR
jgi:hypothetical protein